MTLPPNMILSIPKIRIFSGSRSVPSPPTRKISFNSPRMAAQEIEISAQNIWGKGDSPCGAAWSRSGTRSRRARGRRRGARRRPRRRARGTASRRGGAPRRRARPGGEPGAAPRRALQAVPAAADERARVQVALAAAGGADAAQHVVQEVVGERRVDEVRAPHRRRAPEVGWGGVGENGRGRSGGRGACSSRGDYLVFLFGLVQLLRGNLVLLQW